jgi:hypothetical protein
MIRIGGLGKVRKLRFMGLFWGLDLSKTLWAGLQYNLQEGENGLKHVSLPNIRLKKSVSVILIGHYM